jgi:hypothetical protein
MRSSHRKFAVALAVCTLLPVIAAHAKDKVTRPFQMAAHSQLVIVVDPDDPDYGTYVAHAEGVASHLGQVTADQSGILLPTTQGTMTAANGDSLTFDFNSVTAVIVITGGTGRFTGASGQVSLVVQPVGPPVLDPMAGTMTQKFTWTGSGTIAY